LVDGGKLLLHPGSKTGCSGLPSLPFPGLDFPEHFFHLLKQPNGNAAGGQARFDRIFYLLYVWVVFDGSMLCVGIVFLCQKGFLPGEGEIEDSPSSCFSTFSFFSGFSLSSIGSDWVPVGFLLGFSGSPFFLRTASFFSVYPVDAKLDVRIKESMRF